MTDRSTNWVFTWNNYTPENIQSVRDTWIQESGMNFKCVVFEEEIAPKTGTPHLQGFFVAKTKKSFHQLKAILPAPVSFRPMKGRIDQNVTYCTKDGTGIVKLGDVPMSREEQAQHGQKGAKAGKYEIANQEWLNLQKDCAAGMSEGDLAKAYARIFGVYNKGFKATFEMFKPRQRYNLYDEYKVIFDWENKLLELLTKAPDKRSVIWIWSELGAMGKSEMVKHLVGTLDFQPLQNAPTRDLACAWKGGNVVLDTARSDDTTNYQFIENAKNGLVFSSKYESITKMTNDFKPIHLVCFANTQPELHKLSLDRWQIYRINPDKTWTKQCIIGDMLQDERLE